MHFKTLSWNSIESLLPPPVLPFLNASRSLRHVLPSLKLRSEKLYAQIRGSAHPHRIRHGLLHEISANGTAERNGTTIHEKMLQKTLRGGKKLMKFVGAHQSPFWMDAMMEWERAASMGDPLVIPALFGLFCGCACAPAPLSRASS